MKNVLKMRYPASWWAELWREVVPAGNGIVGVGVYGGVHEETILVNHEDLWANCIKQEYPDVSGRLQEVRELILQGKLRESRHVLSDAIQEKGFKGYTAVPVPVGDIKVLMHEKEGFKDYNRILNMENGEVKVTWMDGLNRIERSLFVSRVYNVIVYKINGSYSGTIDADLWLDLHDPANAVDPVTGNRAELPKKVEIKAEDEFIYYAAANTDAKDFGMVARVVPQGGNIACSGKKIMIRGADFVTVYVKVFVKEDRKTGWERLKRELLDLCHTYEELLSSHANEHGKLFHSATLDLNTAPETCGLYNEELLLEAYKGEVPAAMVEKMWAYGRYLLISACHEGGQPCHLLGLWCGSYSALWGINMANENIQMIYWHALSGNMPELLMPVFDYYDGMMDMFRVNARNIYGCRGIFVPAVTTPGEGYLQCLSDHIVHWTGGAGWIAQLYYDYYLYTGDEEFLRKRALPFMREAVLFYEDFFILGEDGYYISVPSVSPENTPGNYRDESGMGGDMETAINATMDFAIAKEVLRNLLTGAGITGMYKEEIGKWEEMLTRIPPYQVNEDGAIKEWMHPALQDNYHHRHQAHIYPVFPGFEVTPEDDPKLFEAFAKAVELRHTVGRNDQTSWSLAHMACSYSRMEMGDRALQCLDEIARTSVINNFFTLHNDWRNMGLVMNFKIAPFQIDGNMGWTGAVNEMLLFARPGLLKILPALPSRWKQGRAKGFLCRGGIKVDMEWDMKAGMMEFMLKSNTTQTIDIKLPNAIKSISASNVEFKEINGKFIKGVNLVKGNEALVKVRFDNGFCVT